VTKENKGTLNISPDPNILIVLSNTPLKPIDALCELIDNSLDSFDAARRAGLPIPSRWIRILLPSPTQIQNGEGVIRVVDNGIGLDRDGLQGALQAGFSTKNKFGALGLFGVGFNIATAKLGQRTVVTTARADLTGKTAQHALRATIDLQELKRRGDFEVPLEEVANPERGTVVEISDWWPNGTPNQRFAFELARISKPKLLEQLGRRYSTILRDDEKKVNMTVNDEVVVPFEHCVWSEKRAVNRQGIGSIPARITFDETRWVMRRCQTDGNVLEASEKVCGVCGGSDIKQVNERIHGWIGIQRFDDKSNFGIDLIRNGRAIRVAEKEAFFNYTDELGETEKEYPIDQNTGRIVGEVHLDHVPVDYTKQDFERPSREWQEAMEYIRGGALQAKNRPEGVRNETPMGRIFDGYRKVKRYGKEDMYMGTWSETKPDRISRDVEAEYYKRFKAKEPGYYDDQKWWELVENATIPPNKPLKSCDDCGADNPETAQECVGCGKILIGKECTKCGAEILKSASSCPMCGEDQTIQVTGPWKCAACTYLNASDENACSQCGLAKGSANPMDASQLRASANRLDELSFDSLTFKLVDGNVSQPLSVSTYSVARDSLRPFFNQPPIPTYAPPGSSLDQIDIFIDRQHPFFVELGYTAEFAVATQVASFLQALVGSTTNGMTTLNLAHRVLQTAFGERVSLTKESVRAEVEDLLESISDAVTAMPWSSALSTELTNAEMEMLVEKLQQIGKLSTLEQIKGSGQFLRYVPTSLPRLLRLDIAKWIGAVFVDESAEIKDVAPMLAQRASEQARQAILRALEDCTDFLESPTVDDTTLRKVKLSVEFVSARLQ
jgi:hypothetical protein